MKKRELDKKINTGKNKMEKRQKKLNFEREQTYVGRMGNRKDKQILNKVD